MDRVRGDFGIVVGDGVDDLTHKPWKVPAFLLFFSVVGYFTFHAVRDDLTEGLLRASMPSFLLPLAMVATIDLAPGIRFHSRRHRAAILSIAILLAALWFEGIIPLLTDSSTADSRDVLAMFLGSVVAIGLPFFLTTKSTKNTKKKKRKTANTR